MKRAMIILFAILPFAMTAQPTLTLTYVGNMGVLVEQGEHAVIIDGLHDLYKPAYQHPPEDFLTELANRKSPIDLIVNTHVHDDHFDAKISVDFLKEQKELQMAGSFQLTEKLSSDERYEDVRQKVTTFSFEEAEPKAFESNGISGMAFPLEHISPKNHGATKNVGFLLELGDFKVLHTGDTNWNEEVFEKLALQQKEIDVAIIPNWMALTERGADVIRKWINPKQLVVTHISPSHAEMTREQIKHFFPEAVLFTNIREHFTLK